jgi:hypothetical protein
MRILVLQSCVVSLNGTSVGSAFLEGTELDLPEEWAVELVRLGKAEEINREGAENAEYLSGVEKEVIKPRERAVGRRERDKSQ